MSDYVWHSVGTVDGRKVLQQKAVYVESNDQYERTDEHRVISIGALVA